MARGEAKNVPQNAIGRLLADMLYSARSGLNENVGIPFVDTGIGLGDMLMGESPEYIEDLSHGMPLGTGSGQAWQMDHRAMDVAGLPLPYAAAGMIGKKAGSSAIGALNEMRLANTGDLNFIAQSNPKLAKKIADRMVDNMFDNQSKISKLNVKPNLYHARHTSTHNLDKPFEVKEPLYLTPDKHALDYYTASAWDEPGGVVYPFEFNAKNTLDIDDVKDLKILDDIVKELNIDVDVFNPRNSNDISNAVSKRIGTDDVHSGSNLLDIVQIPEVRKLIIDKGFDSLSGTDFLGDYSSHKTVVPLNLNDVIDITGNRLK